MVHVLEYNAAMKKETKLGILEYRKALFINFQQSQEQQKV